MIIDMVSAVAIGKQKHDLKYKLKSLSKEDREKLLALLLVISSKDKKSNNLVPIVANFYFSNNSRIRNIINQLKDKKRLKEFSELPHTLMKFGISTILATNENPVNKMHKY